jgi:hypothetical protein
VRCSHHLNRSGQDKATGHRTQGQATVFDEKFTVTFTRDTNELQRKFLTKKPCPPTLALNGCLSS